MAKIKKPTIRRKPSLAERARRDPALLERAMRDPGLRSRLPEKMLTATQRAARRDNEFKANITDPSRPLTGRNAVRAAESLVDREYRPLLDDIGRSERTVDAQRVHQQGTAGANYGKLQSLFAGNQAAQTQANQQANSGARQAQLDQLAVVDEVQRQAAERQAKDTSIRGEGLDGGATQMLAEQAAQQKMRVAAAGQARETDTAARGDIQSAFIQNLGAGTAARGAEVQAGVGAQAFNQLAELQGDRRKLRQGRDGKLTDTLLRMRGSEVERHLTERGLATEAEKAVLDARTDLAKITSASQLARWKANLTAKLQREGMSSREAIAEADRLSRESTASANRAQSDRNSRRSAATTRRGQDKSAAGRQKKDKNGYLPPTTQQGYWAKISKAAGSPALKNAKTRGEVPRDIRDMPVSGAQLDAAWEIARTGGISSATARRLHADGLQVKGRYPVIPQ